MKNHRNLGFIISLLHYAALAVAQAMATISARAVHLEIAFASPSLNQVALVDGIAALTISPVGNTGLLPLPLGQSYIIAQYDGDATHSPSSKTYKVNIYDELGGPDFSMQTNETYQTISPSSATATFHVHFTSLNRFGALGPKIALSYQTPPNITYSNNPTSPSFSNICSTLTVTCTPTAGTTVAQVTVPRNPRLLWMAEGGTALACVVLFGMRPRRRSWQSLIAGMALVVVAFGLNGCGATVANGPAKNYYDSITTGQGELSPRQRTRSSSSAARRC